MQLVDRKQKCVNRDVVEVLELVLETVAERTIGVGEDDELARAVAFDASERQIERQLVEGNAIDLANLRFRQVLLRRNVVHGADQYLVCLGVRVDQLIAEQRFVQAEIRAFGDVTDVGAGKFLLQRLLHGSSIACKRGGRGLR